MLFSPTSATIIPSNDLIILKFSSFLYFVSKHCPIVSAPLDPTDNLYILPLHHLANIPVITDSFNLPVSLNSVHRYATIKTRTIAEDVDMIHRLYGYCDAEKLISLSSSPYVLNFLKHLSAASIRKNFPLSCPN